MRQPYLIAVCDILGFSELVENNPTELIVTDVLGWFSKSLYHSIHKDQFPDEIPNRTLIEGHELIGSAWFSDTILLYTKRDEDEAIRQLIMTVGWLIFENIFHTPTRIRAGLAYGEAFIDPANAMFVGKPIVEAYRLEKRQQWSGAALTQSACERIPEYARSGKFADWWVVPYPVPLKSNTTIDTLAVNWNWGIHNPDWKMRWSESSEMPEQADWINRRDICEKFISTKRFHETYCLDCKPRN